MYIFFNNSVPNGENYLQRHLQLTTHICCKQCNVDYNRSDKVTFQLCLDFHWKDRLKNSNHVIYKYALQKQRFYCHVKYVMLNYLKRMLPSRLRLQLHLKIFMLDRSCGY